MSCTHFNWLILKIIFQKRFILNLFMSVLYICYYFIFGHRCTLVLTIKDCMSSSS